MQCLCLEDKAQAWAEYEAGFIRLLDGLPWLAVPRLGRFPSSLLFSLDAALGRSSHQTSWCWGSVSRSDG